MRKKIPVLTMTVFVLALGFAALAEAGGPPARATVWVDGELFGTVVTPAVFDPAHGPFDELYTCGPGGAFKDGVPLISEAKPGDQDYNGGRWHLNVLKEGSECNADADSVEELNLNDFDSTDMYFECPLLPMRGQGRS
ncbi:MAG TPA: hypothetical protein VFI27_14445 [candidate division Zixibacteria bacterium]|nr:hypothetical protein [candidate division Zixibacteria bacterium]